MSLLLLLATIFGALLVTVLAGYGLRECFHSPIATIPAGITVVAVLVGSLTFGLNIWSKHEDEQRALETVLCKKTLPYYDRQNGECEINPQFYLRLHVEKVCLGNPRYAEKTYGEGVC